MATSRLSRTLALGSVWLGLAAGGTPLEAQAERTRTAAARATGEPTVRLVGQRPAAPACGAFLEAEWQACRRVTKCSPRTIDSAALAPLESAIVAAHGRHMAQSCSRGGCGEAQPARAGENHFECAGATRLCLTRTLTSRCAGGGPQRVPAPKAAEETRQPRRTAPGAPQRTSPRADGDSARPPARRPGDGTTPRRTAPREAELADPFEPVAATASGPRLGGGGRASRGASATPFLFPARAEGLEGGERWYWKAPDGHGSGTQEFAYDLTTAAFDEGSGQWTECVSDASGKPKCRYCSNAPSNADCLGYGERLYAMAAGRVIRCWRNAPENPRPGQSHPARTSDPPRIGGGGNALVVQHDDGTVALYAHMQPGTIPAALCPKTAELLSEAGDSSEAEIPEGSQPRVAAGAFIGKVGNSGKSSNPHLHVHVQSGPEKSASGVPLDFRGGLIAPEGRDASPAWTRLDGRTRPTVTSVIWPDFSKGFPEIAYHGVRSSDYQSLFDHVSGSGYRLDWIDGFEAGGKLYFNVVFHPGDGKPWAAVHNLTSAQYQQEYDKRKAAGLRLRQVETYTAGGQVRYAALFAKDGGPAVRAYHGRSAAEHQKLLEEWAAEGWRARNISVASAGGQRVYAGLYEKAPAGTSVKSALTPSEYQDEYETNRTAGRHLVYLSAYVHDGRPYFSAIWDRQAPRPGQARHGMTGSGYQDLWEKARADGLLTRSVTGYADGATVRYAAFWRR